MIVLPLLIALVTPAVGASPAPTASAGPTASAVPAGVMSPATSESAPALATPAPAATTAATPSNVPGGLAAPVAPPVAPPAAGAATVTYNYRFVPYPPKDPDAPRIFAVYMNNKTLPAPGPIDIRVDTSPDVVRVEEHTGKQIYPLPMTAPGRFVSNSTLPKVPFIAHGIEVKLDFVAITAAGKKSSVVVPFNLK